MCPLQYHDEVDALSHCSLSKARRWTHYICEDVCNKLNIYMIEGFHFPLGVMLHQVFPQAQQSKEVNIYILKYIYNNLFYL